MYGEVVCGPPGSGKTTYCEGKRQFLSLFDPSRPVILLNLDPANEGVFPYPCDVDVRDLVCHERVMESEALGPNGTYIFCSSILEENVEWLMTSIQEAVRRKCLEVANLLVNSTPRSPYLIIDCPGQVEFYISSSFMHSLVRALQKRLRMTLCTVHLVDASIATRDIPTYVSSCLLALTTMIDHELPHVNVLTKWDAVKESLGDEGAEVFTNVSELANENFDRLWSRQLQQRRLAHRQAQYSNTSASQSVHLDKEDREEDEALAALHPAARGGRMYRFSKVVMEVVDSYGMLGFTPLDVQSQEMMTDLTQRIDAAMGLFC